MTRNWVLPAIRPTDVQTVRLAWEKTSPDEWMMDSEHVEFECCEVMDN